MYNTENNLYIAFEDDEAEYAAYDEYESYTTAELGLPTSIIDESRNQNDALPTGSLGTWTTLLAVLLALVFVLFLAYYATRITGRGRGGRLQKTRNLRTVEVLGVNPHTTVQLIKAGDKYFVVGVSRQGLTPLGEVDADSIVVDEPLTHTRGENPFDKYLSRFTKKKDETPKGDD